MITGTKYSIRNISFKRIAATTLAVVIFLVILICSSLIDFADSSQVTKTQIDQLRAEKREYERQKREIQSKIDAIEFEHLTEMAKKEVLDQRIRLTALEIKNTNNTIEQLYLLIREKEYEVFLAQNREESQFHKYRNRVRDMEENGIITYLEIVFDATSFSDLLARIDFVGDIMRADRRLFDDLQVARSEIEDAKADLEEVRTELEEEKEQLEFIEAELIEQLDQAHELILNLQANIEAEKQLRDQMIAEEARVQREINAAIEQLRRQEEEAERQRRLREESQQGSAGGGGSGSGSGSDSSSGGSSGGGSGGGSSGGSGGSGQFTWPVPGGSIISRWGAPRGGRLHQGLDISGAHGANVVAGDSGTVITSSYGSGYGYYVTVSHGNGIATLYSHLSSSAVNVGDSVSRGQVIGYVGSTGNATTPHLHFEVFVNGTRVNPEGWVSR